MPQSAIGLWTKIKIIFKDNVITISETALQERGCLQVAVMMVTVIRKKDIKSKRVAF